MIFIVVRVVSGVYCELKYVGLVLSVLFVFFYWIFLVILRGEYYVYFIDEIIEA